MNALENSLAVDSVKASWKHNLRIATGLFLAGCVMVAAASIGLA